MHVKSTIYSLGLRSGSQHGAGSVRERTQASPPPRGSVLDRFVGRPPSAQPAPGRLCPRAQKSMPIHVIVSEIEPLLSEGLARGLRDEPHLAASAAAGTPRETLEQCRRSQPCVLLAAEPVLERVQPGYLQQQLDYGRAIPVLVLGPSLEPERVTAWLRLGCMGYLTRNDSLDTLRKALYAVAEGQLWARRSDLTLLWRQLLSVTQTASRFTAREREILDCIAAGSSNAKIASDLFISPETVRWHLRRLCPKAGVRDRLGLVAFARQHGFGWRAAEISAAAPPRPPASPQPLPVQRSYWNGAPRVVATTTRL